MITEICLSGAMHRGITEIGALRAIEELNIINLKKAVGTSIGSIILFLYIIGYTSIELIDIILNTDISLFGDITIKNPKSLLEGKEIKNWIIKLANIKCNTLSSITTVQFYDLYKIHFISAVVSLEDGLEYMDHISHPDILIIDQLIATISLPFIFPPCIINSKTYLDGGLLDNFPVHLLNKGSQSIGIEIKKTQTHNEQSNNRQSNVQSNGGQSDIINLNIVQYAKKIINTISKNKSYSCDYEPYTVTIYQEYDSDFINFYMNRDDIINYYKFGYNNTINSNAYRELVFDIHKKKFNYVLEYIIL